MASPRLFRLKAEVATAPSGPKALSFPFATIRLDSGVFHLDHLYDYLVPEKLSHAVQTGVRVQLPFGSKQIEGIVVERSIQADRAGDLKSITKVLSVHPVATPASLQLYDRVATKYACNPWDIIRSAIPPRVASVDKVFISRLIAPTATKQNHKFSQEFVQLAPFKTPHHQLAELITRVIHNGSVLVVVPDETDADHIVRELTNSSYPVLKLTAAMPREKRYQNYLDAINNDISIVVGTRSAVFVPVHRLSTLIIFKESALEHYEMRSPGWNTKAVAQDRAINEELTLLLTGFSPSLEVAQQIDAREIKFTSFKQEVSVKAFAPDDGALLPGRIFAEIRSALKCGPVLFLAARKGYGNALLCAHCRNIAHCECGGRLLVAAKTKPPSCVHCGANFPQWRCSFCKRDKQYLGGRGIERASEEIARAFPNIPVVISSGSVIKAQIDTQPALVLATPGAQPFVAGGYAAVVILDGVRFFSHTDVRTQERARELFFETAALINPQGSVLLVIDNVHPIISAIARWNVGALIKRELAERQDVGLPPTVASAVLVLDQVEALTITKGLRQAVTDSRLPSSVQIFGPTAVANEQVKLVLLCKHPDFDGMCRMLHELQRKRSIARKPLFTLRLAPYSL